jgi:MFS transporter, AAHS family, benzoate transport protein
MSDTTTAAPASGWVRGLCWSAVALEGYDLVVLGVVLPVLLRDPTWGLTPASASLVATVGLVGVMVGALSVGPVSDLVGRRRTLVATVVLFSLLSLACAAAAGPTSLAVLRFLAGVGLGGVLPVALATVAEHAPARRGNAATTIMMTGYHVGAVAAALLGIALIPRLGWPVMFALGAVPALLLVPLMLAHLPHDGGRDRPSGPAVRAGANPVRALFRDGRARATISFWVASFMGLLLVYGLNTWLPEIMRSAGYPLGAALALLLTLNVGAVVGLLVGGPVADRIGVRVATITWFVLGAVFLALLSVRLPGAGVYAIVLLAGIFVFSAQVLVYSWVGRFYPAAARGTALGAASGVGRLGAITGPALGGALLTAGLAYPWGFYAFALVAALGAVAVLGVGRGPAGAPADAKAPAAPAEGAPG